MKMRASLLAVALALMASGVAADEESMPDWMVNGGWALLVLGTLVSFWGLAVICEDFFVPALNVMCERLKIPDDVAGATFMAAGASSPEMFAAFVSLFITRSALGAGTIIGSEIFNHLIICAASVFYAKGGVLQLDYRFVVRESFFYALALGLLIYALSIKSTNNDTCHADITNYLREQNAPNGTTGEPFDDPVHWTDPENEDVYCIYWHQGLVLVCGYAVYALTCAYYSKLMPYLPVPASETNFRESTTKAGRPSINAAAMAEGELASRFTEVREPAANFQDGDNDDTTNRMTRAVSGAVRATVATVAPRLGALFDIHSDSGEASSTSQFYGCYLYKRSRYYKYFTTANNAWRVRWMEFDTNHGLRSFHHRERRTKMKKYNLLHAEVKMVDSDRFLFLLIMDTGSLLLQAPSEQILENTLVMLEKLIDEASKTAAYDTEKTTTTISPMAMGEDDATKEKAADFEATRPSELQRMQDHDDGDEDNENLLEWPESDNYIAVALHLFLFPIKVLVYYTVPDVRHGGDPGKKYGPSICMCFFWLIAFSYVMATCIEDLGNILGVPSVQMGMTVSAAGTSFPNVFSSMIVAKQGLGNMAVSNALGGNVFNVFMGLGLPWLLYALFGDYMDDSDLHMYFGLEVTAVVLSVAILLGLLVTMLLILIVTGWKLYKIHAYIAVLCYFAFFIWVFVGFE